MSACEQFGFQIAMCWEHRWYFYWPCQCESFCVFHFYLDANSLLFHKYSIFYQRATQLYTQIIYSWSVFICALLNSMQTTHNLWVVCSVRSCVCIIYYRRPHLRVVHALRVEVGEMYSTSTITGLDKDSCRSIKFPWIRVVANIIYFLMLKWHVNLLRPCASLEPDLNGLGICLVSSHKSPRLNLGVP